MLNLVRKRLCKKQLFCDFIFDLGKGVKMAVSAYNLVERATKFAKVKLARDTGKEVKMVEKFINPNTSNEFIRCFHQFSSRIFLSLKFELLKKNLIGSK